MKLNGEERHELNVAIKFYLEESRASTEDMRFFLTDLAESLEGGRPVRGRFGIQP